MSISFSIIVKMLFKIMICTNTDHYVNTSSTIKKEKKKNFVTFVVLKILGNLISIQVSLNANNCWQSKISRAKLSNVTLPLYLNFLSGSSISFCLVFSSPCKKMLLASRKMVFIKNEAMLPCVTMRECTRPFAATI